MATTSPTSPPGNRSAGRGLLLAGTGLGVLAVVLLVVQYLFLKILIVPWYAPILFAVGALLIFVSLLRRVSVPRMLLLLLQVGLAGMAWYTLAVEGKLPQYTGPAEAGKKLPAFHTTLADGSSFTQNDLEDGQRRVLTFFRGRW